MNPKDLEDADEITLAQIRAVRRWAKAGIVQRALCVSIPDLDSFNRVHGRDPTLGEMLEFELCLHEGMAKRINTQTLREELARRDRRARKKAKE